MASRRELKKSVNYISGELFAECLVNAMFIPGTDKAKAEDIMAEIPVSYTHLTLPTNSLV